MKTISGLILLSTLSCSAQDASIFPGRSARASEIRGSQSAAAAKIIALETRALEVLNATDFGVRCDGRTDDTTAATQAFNVAWSTGKTLQFPSGDCLMGNIALPAPAGTVNQTLSFRGEGTGMWFGLGTQMQSGTRLRFVKRDHSDFLVANSTAFAVPTYQISDISIFGPDTWRGTAKGTVASTTSSGSGLKFAGKAVPRLLLHNVNIEGFYGPGSAGLWVDNAEDSSLYDVYIANVEACAHFSGAFNASTVVNFSCQAAMNDGVFITESQSLTWVGGLFQSNRMTGMHLKGVLGSHFTGVHFENNNWSAAPGEGALKIEAVYTPQCPTQVSCLSNQNLLFTGNVFNAATDRIISKGGGPDGWSNSNITVMNGYANAVAAPFLTLGEYSFNWRIIGIVGLSSGVSQISDSGTGNSMIVGNQMIGLHDGIALSAIGDLNVTGHLRLGGNGESHSLKAKTGTRFVCVDTTGTLVSQTIPCSGT